MKFRREIALSPGSRVAGVLGTLLIHGGAIGALLLAARASASSTAMIYSIELVAAPLPSKLARAAPAAAPTPPAPPIVAPKPSKKAVPVPKPKPPAKVDPKTEPAPPTKTANTPVPGATPSTGTDVDNVKVQGGLTFPYPEYLRKMMNEILRRWARPVGAGALEAEVSFTIQRDGSVRDIRITRASRNYTFNLEAQGAVEQAGEARAFGPLPKEWPSEILQVAFLFTPRKPQ